MKASTRHSVATKRFLALGIAACACAAASLGELPPQMRFDLDPPPATFPADAYRTNGVETVFYESIPFKGRPTRVFAYYGVPKSADGRKVPGMVLIHGGGGSAFYRWVKFWNDKGYAAISMDTCGCVSGNVIGNEQRAHFRHEWGGPAGWGGFNTLDAPVEDQWCRHAMAAVIRGHSLLRSLPGVDPDRIGVTGVSWGGVLTCLVAGADPRFAFAAPVYGCGDFLGSAPATEKTTPSVITHWNGLWNPSTALKSAHMLVMWLVGTNDRFFSLPAVMSSYASVPGDKALAIRVRMAHAHGKMSEEAPELLALADYYLRGGPALPRLGDALLDNGTVSATCAADPRMKPVRAFLDYTLDAPPGLWFARKWESAPATLAEGRVAATLPSNAKAWYMSVETADGCRVSTPVAEARP